MKRMHQKGPAQLAYLLKRASRDFADGLISKDELVEINTIFTRADQIMAKSKQKEVEMLKNEQK